MVAGLLLLWRFGISDLKYSRFMKFWGLFLRDSILYVLISHLFVSVDIYLFLINIDISYSLAFPCSQSEWRIQYIRWIMRHTLFWYMRSHLLILWTWIIHSLILMLLKFISASTRGPALSSWARIWPSSYHYHYQHIEAEAEWPSFFGRHIQIHFLEWNICISILIALKFLPTGLFDNKPVSV